MESLSPQPKLNTDYLREISGIKDPLASNEKEDPFKNEYRVEGDDFQNLVLSLKPGEKIIIDQDSLVFRDTGIDLDAKLPGGITKSIKRVFSGEDLFVPELTNSTDSQKEVTVSGETPGKIFTLDLSKYGEDGFIFQPGSFLASKGNVDVSVKFPGITRGILGGEGLFMQKISGEGMAFVHAGGNLIRRQLQPGESLVVNTGHLVGYEPTVNMDIKTVKGLKNKLVSGQGFFDTVMTGPGEVLIQSLPVYKNMNTTSNGSSSGGELIGSAAAEVLKAFT